jgi:hypothetical protein
MPLFNGKYEMPGMQENNRLRYLEGLGTGESFLNQLDLAYKTVFAPAKKK